LTEGVSSKLLGDGKTLVGGDWRTGHQEDKDKSERIPTAIIIVRNVTGHDRNIALIFG
jgi:hypothetical protein